MDSIQRIRNEMEKLKELVYFDENHFLREKVEDLSKLETIIQNVEEIGKVASKNDDVQFIYSGALGNLYRIKEEPKKAIFYLEQAIDIALRVSDNNKYVTTLIRLGEAKKYNNELEEALTYFEKALTVCNEENLISLIDFAYQHKGKCLLELDRLEESIISLTEALKIRVKKGDKALIKSTKDAIQLGYKMLKEKTLPYSSI
ncbi:tetratricopeptide repeat protein [Sutcliffiella cohnii]|uniref:tetratricopeptide repeat protein n=1 Tax=Sutcliffiella cohnii TaxID=33932 RepID=UPI002E1E2C68|nr:tetratricopeptide repeat protein [Sutcliffiella cohnii]